MFFLFWVVVLEFYKFYGFEYGVVSLCYLQEIVVSWQIDDGDV